MFPEKYTYIISSFDSTLLVVVAITLGYTAFELVMVDRPIGSSYDHAVCQFRYGEHIAISGVHDCRINLGTLPLSLMWS